MIGVIRNNLLAQEYRWIYIYREELEGENVRREARDWMVDKMAAKYERKMDSSVDIRDESIATKTER